MQGIVGILKILASGATIATGLLALVKPRSIFDFIGLKAEGGRGITEIRAIFGAFFIGLGGAALYFRQSETYIMLGVTYLLVALIRLVSMLADKSVEKSNIISLIAEVVLGVMLVLP